MARRPNIKNSESEYCIHDLLLALALFCSLGRERCTDQGVIVHFSLPITHMHELRTTALGKAAAAYRHAHSQCELSFPSLYESEIFFAVHPQAQTHQSGRQPAIPARLIVPSPTSSSYYQEYAGPLLNSQLSKGSLFIPTFWF
jgi:hypothetical protein